MRRENQTISQVFFCVGISGQVILRVTSCYGNWCFTQAVCMICHSCLQSLTLLILCIVPCLQISIFMTHLSNYGSDRLALLVFDSLVKYLQCWTNLKLSTEHPTALAERYFAMFPGEVEPIWQVLSLCMVLTVWYILFHNMLQCRNKPRSDCRWQVNFALG